MSVFCVESLIVGTIQGKMVTTSRLNVILQWVESNEVVLLCNVKGSLSDSSSTYKIRNFQL